MFREIMYLLRNKVFWLKDFILGRPIRSAYKNLVYINSLAHNSEKLINYKKEHISDLLFHAIANTKFYKKHGDVNLKLNKFPVIDKNTIKQSEKEFLAENYKNKKLYKMATSGSTGIPFVVYQDIKKKKHVIAEIIYYSEPLGYKIGKKLIFLRAINETTKKNKMVQFIQNETLIDIKNLSESNIKLIIENIKKASKEGATILAYASTYDVLKDYLIKSPMKLKPNIKGIISGAEMLHDETRLVISKEFNAPMISRYSNQENGVLAQDNYENNIFVVNEAHYHIEILDFENDKVLNQGEVGRIVITDLYNFAMPLIRYDTGDIGALSTRMIDGKKKLVIESFGGRKRDLLNATNGQLVSPSAVTVLFWKFKEIQQFQFIQQTTTEYEINLNINSEFFNEETLEKNLNEIFGDDAVFTFNYVNEIPLLNSGKRRTVINNAIGR